MEQTAPEIQTMPDLAALRLDGFRRALRDREQRAFDRVLRRAQTRASAAAEAAAGGPAEVLFLSVLIEQELSIMRMEAAIEELCWSVLGHSVGPEGQGAAPPAPRGAP
ncbi:MAG TPA: hypothetical protein VGB42_09465 [Candidatus Thermoplasmatota archaeon]